MVENLVKYHVTEYETFRDVQILHAHFGVTSGRTETLRSCEAGYNWSAWRQAELDGRSTL